MPKTQPVQRTKSQKIGGVTKVSPAGGSFDVNLQDQTTPQFSLYFSQNKADATLTANSTIDTNTITYDTGATTIVVGDYLFIFNIANSRFYAGFATAVVGAVVTLDTPLNFAYQSGDLVRVQTAEMSVDGSTTRQDFSIAGPGAGPDIDITRLIFTMQLTTQPDDGLFGNIARLTQGITIRRRDGTYENYANFKDNSDLANLCYDINYSSRSGGGGTWGLRARWTFGGQNKMGVVVRLTQGEFLEALVDDDLTTGSPDITSFRMIAQGHFVDED